VFLSVTGLAGMIIARMQSVISDPYLMSFLFAFGVLVICWLVVLPFYLKKIFLKI
jgi:hypothetical protein